MKGYVNVEVGQVKEAISGFEAKRNLGRQIRDDGIARYYQKYYVLGGWFTKWRYRNKSKIEFARAHLCAFSTWDDLLCEVLTNEETEVLTWWSWNNSDYKVNPLKALVSQCATGFILVDNEMAAIIENYRSYK